MFLKLYSKKTDELRKECIARNLPSKGPKIELIKTLLPEVKNYVHLDKKVAELKRIHNYMGVDRNKLTRGEMIYILNNPNPPKLKITITKLDSSVIEVNMTPYNYIYQLKRNIVKQEGLLGKYIELYNTQKVVGDYEILMTDEQFTMVINEMPSINPYTGRCLTATSMITNKLIQCYSNPDVVFTSRGNIRKIDSITYSHICMKMPIYNFYFLKSVVNAKEDFINHLIYKFTDTNYSNILDALRYMLKYIQCIKEHAATNSIVSCYRGDGWNCKFFKKITSFIEWKYHSDKDFAYYNNHRNR